MEVVGELLFAFLEVLIIPIAYILKAIWSSLLLILSVGYIPFMTSWNSKKMDLCGVALIILSIIGLAIYFIFRGSYYFN